jgi:hypothetical protein
MVNPLRATKYTGMNQIYAAPVSHPRRPTTADYRNPENAKLYRISTVWQVGLNPSDGVHGELWMLSKIVANIATWVMISGGNVGTVVSVTGDDGVVTVPDGGGNIDLVGNVVGNATHPKPLYVQTGGANTEQWDIQLATAVAPTPLDANDAGIASFNNTQFSVDPTSGMVSLVDPVDADLHVARFIVSAGGTADGANYTTIADAITAAVLVGGSQTIAIQPGTYTENITLPASINLTAFPCDAQTPSVTILGTISCTDAGTRSISNVRLSTNGAAAISVTGVAATNVRIFGCTFNASNAFAIVGSSSGNGTVWLENCGGGASGANSMFTLTNGTNLVVINSRFTGTTTSSTVGSGCDLGFISCSFFHPITTSGTATMGGRYVYISSTATSLVIGSTGEQNLVHSVIGGSAAVAAITINAGCTLTISLSEIVGATPNVITGAGTINRGLLVFTGSGSTITVATQNALPVI